MARAAPSVRGPRFSSRTSAERSGMPSIASTSRRGVAKAAAKAKSSPACVNPSVNRRLRSSAARACMRAGISSDKNSRTSLAIAQPFASQASQHAFASARTRPI